jgi:hypothetical protein
MKIIFTISCILLSQAVFSQVTQTPNLLQIGNQTPSGHSLLVGLPTATEVGRFQTTTNGTYPFIDFYSNNNALALIGTSTNFSLQPRLYFSISQNESSRFVFENSTTNANAFTFAIHPSQNQSQQELQALQGIKLKNHLILNGTVGTEGQIVTSRGSSFSPVWATTHDDPKQGVNAYINNNIALSNNTSELLSNFTITNEDVSPYLIDSFDETSGIFMARQAGLYHFDMYVSGFEVASNSATINLFLLKNDIQQVEITKDYGKNGVATAMTNSVYLSQNIYLNMNDTVRFSILQTNIDGLTLNINPTVSDKKIKLGIFQIYSY